jgi:hypothetical protein
MTYPKRKSEFSKNGGVEIETYIDGEGPAFVILPSYGRDGGDDYDAITARVVNAGWRVLRPQPRGGVAGSKGPMTGLTMHDLANDVAFVDPQSWRQPCRLARSCPSATCWRAWSPRTILTW